MVQSQSSMGGTSVPHVHCDVEWTGSARLGPDEYSPTLGTTDLQQHTKLPLCLAVWLSISIHPSIYPPIHPSINPRGIGVLVLGVWVLVD